MTKCAYESCSDNAIYRLLWYRRNVRGEIEGGIDCKVCSCESHIGELAIEHKNYGLVDRLDALQHNKQTKDYLKFRLDEANDAIKKKNFTEDWKKFFGMKT